MTPTDETDLRAAMERFGAAWASGDIAALGALLSPSYSHTDATGALQGHDAWLAYAARRTGRSTAITFRDVAVRAFGDIAIVTGINDLTGPGVLSPTDQRPLSIAFTQVWRREGGTWLREAFQATPIQVASAG